MHSWSLKLLATIFTLGSGGVSAMFVPLLLVGGALGNAYAQSVVHSPTHDLYAAVGMAAFIAAGYKTPLTAVVFVAETTGGHSYIIPSLIGAAVAYAISGEASVSGDQHLHETAKLADLSGMIVRDVLQPQVIFVQSSTTIREFIESVAVRHRHTIFPVYENDKAIGTICVSDLSEVPPEQWAELDRRRIRGSPRDSRHRRLRTERSAAPAGEGRRPQMLLVTDASGALQGVLTKTDILRAVRMSADPLVNCERDYPLDPLLTGTKSRIFFLTLGAGITPAQGSVKPRRGFTFKSSLDLRAETATSSRSH